MGCRSQEAEETFRALVLLTPERPQAGPWLDPNEGLGLLHGGYTVGFGPKFVGMCFF